MFIRIVIAGFNKEREESRPTGQRIQKKIAIKVESLTDSSQVGRIDSTIPNKSGRIERSVPPRVPAAGQRPYGVARPIVAGVNGPPDSEKMIGFSNKNKLEKKFKKLLAACFELSHSNRLKSDQSLLKANEVLQQIEESKKQLT